jgi:hypothetical protein
MFLVSIGMFGQRPGASRTGGGGVLGMQLAFVLFVAILPTTYMMQPENTSQSRMYSEFVFVWEMY